MWGLLFLLATNPGFGGTEAAPSCTLQDETGRWVDCDRYLAAPASPPPAATPAPAPRRAPPPTPPPTPAEPTIVESHIERGVVEADIPGPLGQMVKDLTPKARVTPLSTLREEVAALDEDVAAARKGLQSIEPAVRDRARETLSTVEPRRARRRAMLEDAEIWALRKREMCMHRLGRPLALPQLPVGVRLTRATPGVEDHVRFHDVEVCRRDTLITHADLARLDRLFTIEQELSGPGNYFARARRKKLEREREQLLAPLLGTHSLAPAQVMTGQGPRVIAPLSSSGIQTYSSAD